MAIFPWVRTHKAQQVDLGKFAHVERWYNALFERPAVKRGLDLGKELRAPALTDDARKALFGQTSASVQAGDPWTYLAFRNIQPLAKELNVAIQWRPVLVGGIFNTVNQRMYASREDSQSPRNRYVLKDLQDCARQTGIKIVFPPKVFPVNSVKAMRGCIWLARSD
eukprot:gene39350-63018_t